MQVLLALVTSDTALRSSLWLQIQFQWINLLKTPELNCDYSRSALHVSPFTPSETSRNSMLHNQQNGMIPPTEHVIFYMEDTFTVLYWAALLSFCRLTDEKGGKCPHSKGEACDNGTFFSHLPKCWTHEHNGKLDRIVVYSVIRTFAKCWDLFLIFKRTKWDTSTWPFFPPIYL